MRQMSYFAYISSARWRWSPARLGELEASGHRCRTCFALDTAAAPLEVHHRTYDRLGRELIGDLTALCRECHSVITDMLLRRRYASIRPRVVNTRPLFERPTPLFDPTVGVRFNEYRRSHFAAPDRGASVVDA
jgi:hypothetical protein